MGENIRVYFNTPSFHIRGKTNTDWQYQRVLKALPKYEPSLTIRYQQSLLKDCQMNFRVAIGIAVNKFHLSSLSRFAPSEENTVSLRDLHNAQCDVVYSYGAFPVNVTSVPVVYHTGATYTELLRKRGMSEREINREIDKKRRFAERAALVTVNSNAALENLGTLMPEFRSKLRTIPFFLPHIAPVGLGLIHKKFRNPPILRLLFVGRQARLKGLSHVIHAFQTLNREFPGQIHLTVVSNMSDGTVELPLLPNLTYHKSLTREEVQALMRDSHIMLMPSKDDSYGWVYLEAMAAGAVPVAWDNPVQREILNNGQCGFLVGPDTNIADRLYPYVRDVSMLETIALDARNHCAANFTPQVVAARMTDLFKQAAEKTNAC